MKYVSKKIIKNITLGADGAIPNKRKFSQLLLGPIFYLESFRRHIIHFPIHSPHAIFIHILNSANIAAQLWYQTHQMGLV